MTFTSCAGVLLTGGASRRMGTDKATLVVRGEALAARAARVLTSVCGPALEVGPGVTALACAREEPPGAGPLAAFLTGVDALGAPGPVLLLACDLPLVDEHVLRVLAEWPGSASAVPVVRGRPQYACARWSPAAIAAGRAAFDAGEQALRALAAVDAEELRESAFTGATAAGVAHPADVFADLDTPEDLRRLGLS